MDPKRVVDMLEQIGNLYDPILDESAKWIIPDAVGRLKASRSEYLKRNVKTWGYTIYDDRPLRFKKSSVGGYLPQVDIYCDIQWKEDDLPFSQDIKIRIWSQHPNLTFREKYDAISIQEEMKNRSSDYPGRVISRFHFDKIDLANQPSEQHHPLYHVQVGGNAPDYELCWHPAGFDLPRIAFHPMELFLACQLVAANFFVKEYEDIQKDGTWKLYLIDSQKRYLLDYYKKCVDLLERKKSLIDTLCLSPEKLSTLLRT